MAIEVDGKTYRNLPEQVEENANNIQWLLETIQSFGNVMRYCGSVATYDDLPTEDNKVGDVYNVIDTGNNYAWDGEGWDEISSIVDLSGYVTKINCHLPEYEFSTENIISTIEQYGLKNKAIIVNGPTHKMIVYITERLNQYAVNGYNLRNSSFIGFAVQPTSTWANIPSSFMVFDYQMQEYSKRYIGTYVGAEDEFIEEMNVGDIIMESTGGQFLINEITFSGSTLTKVILVGLEDNGNPVVHKFENGAWSSSNYVDSAIASLSAGTFNVINASDILNNTLTQEQYDLITNGKETRIIGNLGNYNSATIVGTKSAGNFTYCLIEGLDGYGQAIIGVIRINNTSLLIQYQTTYNLVLTETGCNLTNLIRINGKTIPTYPSDTTKQYKLVQQIGGTLAWVEDV